MKIYCLFCFVFYLRFKECVLESNNKETIYLCFFPFRLGIWYSNETYSFHLSDSMVDLFECSTSTIFIDHWTIHYVWWLTTIFFFVMIPFYIYLLGSRLYGYILIVILLFSSVLCHVIKSGKSGNFQIFLLM